MILAGQYFSNLPYSLYAKSDFWLNSPGLIVIKLGVVLLFLAFTFVWSEYAVGASWNWIRQLGTTSLLVYWVHIELVYGRWFGSWKETLNNIECAVCAAAGSETTRETARENEATAMPVPSDNANRGRRNSENLGFMEDSVSSRWTLPATKSNRKPPLR